MDALRTACRNGDIETVTRLIDTVDNINELDKHNSSLLDTAVTRGHVEIVKLLIDKGADVHLKLGFEGKGNFLHIVSTILDPNVFPQVDPTKKKDYEEIARILIEAGVDANKTDWRGPRSAPTKVKEIKVIYDNYISRQLAAHQRLALAKTLRMNPENPRYTLPPEILELIATAKRPGPSSEVRERYEAEAAALPEVPAAALPEVPAAEEPAAESTGGSKRRKSKRRTKKNKRKTKKNKRKSKKARSKKRTRRK
jgi:hypothetical protein